MATQTIKLEDVMLKYNCPAYPPFGIDMKLLYHIAKDENGIGFYYEDFKIYAELWFIKMLFTPVKATWGQIEELLK